MNTSTEVNQEPTVVAILAACLVGAASGWIVGTMLATVLCWRFGIR